MLGAYFAKWIMKPHHISNELQALLSRSAAAYSQRSMESAAAAALLSARRGGRVGVRFRFPTSQRDAMLVAGDVSHRKAATPVAKVTE